MYDEFLTGFNAFEVVQTCPQKLVSSFIISSSIFHTHFEEIWTTNRFKEPRNIIPLDWYFWRICKVRCFWNRVFQMWDVVFGIARNYHERFKDFPIPIHRYKGMFKSNPPKCYKTLIHLCITFMDIRNWLMRLEAGVFKSWNDVLHIRIWNGRNPAREYV